MNNFYTAVEGKTFRGLPVYKFTGKREAMIDRGEFDFDGYEFICLMDKQGDWECEEVIITPESLPRLKGEIGDFGWDWIIDARPEQRLIEIDGLSVPVDGVMITAAELEWGLGTDAGQPLQLDWPEFRTPPKFYEAVEGKTFRGLPVYKFTGERWCAVQNFEVDFDGCEFVALRDEDPFYDSILIHPDSHAMLEGRMYVGEPIMFYAGELDGAGAYEPLQLDWPEFGVPADA